MKNDTTKTTGKAAGATVTVAASAQNVSVIAAAPSGNSKVSVGQTDHLDGGAKADLLVGVGKTGSIDGGAGNDVLLGVGKTGALTGGAGSDLVVGLGKNNTIDGGAGNDHLVGGGHNDVIHDGAGNDRVIAGGGDDVAIYTLALNAGSHDDFNGGGGTDTLRLTFTREEWQRLDVRQDVDAYLAHLAKDKGCNSYDFKAFDLSVKNFEKLEVVVDGVVIDPKDNAVDARDDAFTTDEDVPLSGAVLGNDAAADFVDKVALVGAPALGRVVFNADGSFNYVPGEALQGLAAGETVTDTFSYRLSDLDGDSDVATVRITITGTNDGPVAVADAAETAENQALVVDVLANDTDADAGHSFTLLAAAAPEGKGSIAIADGKLAFAPGADFDHLAVGESETVVVSYTMRDEHGAESSASLTVTVTGTNDAPVAVADAAQTEENTALLLDVLANDRDVDNGAALTLAAVAAPEGKGSVTIVDGQLAFDPGSAFDHLAVGASETVVLTYTVRDEHGAESSASVTLTVTGTNDGPVAVADAAATAENAALVIDVLANDTDVDDGHAFTLLGASAPEGKGVVSVVDGKLVFEPGAAFDHLAAGQSETVELTYTMADEHGAESAATVLVTVTGTNDRPVAVADAAQTEENTALLIDALANDHDADAGAALTLAAVVAPEGKGTASIVDGQIAFDPGADFDHLAVGQSEVVVLRYTIRDEHGAESSAAVTLTVTGTNDGPVAVADAGATNEETALVLDVLGNDTDADDGHTLTLLSASAPEGKGTASVVDGKLVFEPGADFQALGVGESETVELTYTMADEHGAESAATVLVTVTGTNDRPVAVADVAQTEENTALVLDVLANDHDPDGNAALALVAVEAPAGKGSVSVVDGKLAFEPGTAFDHLAVGQSEVVTLAYTVRDEHGAEVTSSVALTVTGSNDGPVAAADTGRTTEDAALVLNVLGNDSDADDGAVLALVAAEAPEGKGTASIVDGKLVYDPGADFQALAAGDRETVVVTYTVRDEHGAESTATAAITVVGTNDAPIAYQDRAATDENTAVVIDVLANDHDPDSATALILSAVAAPEGKGTASIVDGKLVYDPGADFDHLAEGRSETVALTYTMRDEHGAESSATVTVTVTGTNDAPVAVADKAAGNEDARIVLDVLANDTDADDHHSLTLLSAEVPEGQGSVAIENGKLVYDPRAAFDHLEDGESASVVVTYRLRDERGAESTATATVTVLGSTDAPRLAADRVTTTENATLLIDALANDGVSGRRDGYELVAVTAPLGKGTATVVDGQVAFDPGADFDGLAAGQVETVQLTYTVRNAQDKTSSAVINVVITGTNDGPAAAADSAKLIEDRRTTIDVLANDTDADAGAILSLVSATAPEGKGSVAIVDGKLVYSAGKDFDYLGYAQTETVTLTYTVCDEHGATASASVKVLVKGTNEAPVAVADTVVALENQVLTIDALANDQDVDSDHAFQVVSVEAPAGKGAVSVVDNTIVYSAGSEFDHLAGGETETVVLKYTMRDEHGAQSRSQVTVTVTGVNDAPIALDSLAETNADTLVEGVITASDVDSPAAGFTYTLVDGPDHGTLVLGKDGSYRYQGAEGYVGKDAFVVRVADGHGGYDDAKVSVGVSDRGVLQTDLRTEEVLVNTTTKGTQNHPAVSALADGGHVVAWSSLSQDGSSWGVYGQRFDATGNPAGGEFRINSFTTGAQMNVDIAGTKDGGYVATWQSMGQDGSGNGIYAQRYNAAGVAVGGEFMVTASGANEQNEPSVVALKDGGFAFTWTAYNSSTGSWDSFVRAFDANGQALSGDVVMNTYTPSAQKQFGSLTQPVAALENGGFVSVWESLDQDGSQWGVYGQRFDAAGKKVGGEFRVPTTTADD